jgi:hypothetical protein
LDWLWLCRCFLDDFVNYFLVDDVLHDQVLLSPAHFIDHIVFHKIFDKTVRARLG